MMISDRPEATASSTTYWIIGLSTSGSISFGCALVAGSTRVPTPFGVSVKRGGGPQMEPAEFAAIGPRSAPSPIEAARTIGHTLSAVKSRRNVEAPLRSPHVFRAGTARRFRADGGREPPAPLG